MPESGIKVAFGALHVLEKKAAAQLGLLNS
jgi:hypothetical protein